MCHHCALLVDEVTRLKDRLKAVESGNKKG